MVSKENGNPDIRIENNKLNYVGELNGEITSFYMSTFYKAVQDMVNVFNELPNYFNVGDTTQVIFRNIKINTRGWNKTR